MAAGGGGDGFAAVGSGGPKTLVAGRGKSLAASPSEAREKTSLWFANRNTVGGGAPPNPTLSQMLFVPAF